MFRIKAYVGLVLGVMGFSLAAGDASVYIQKGLQAQFDGIDNAGYGSHDSSATTWKDLTGNGYDGTVSTSIVSWGTTGWTNISDGRPVALPLTFSALLNKSSAFTIDFSLMPTRSNVRECYLSQYNTTGFGIEHNAGGVTSGLLRFFYNGSPDLRSASPLVASLAGSADNFIYTAKSKAHTLYKNGVASWTDATAITTVPLATRHFYIGGEGKRTNMGFRGTWYSLRVYNRILTADEAAINSAIDQVRFLGKTVATVNSSVMPKGWLLTDDVLLRRQYANLTLGTADFLEEDSIEFTNTVSTSTLSFGALASEGATRTLTGELVADGALEIDVPAAVDVGDWVLVQAKAIVTNGTGSITLAPACATGIGTARTLEITGTQLILHVTAQSTDTLGTSKYIRDGLLAFYDGFDNAGTGTQDASATTWYDLSGNGHHASLTTNGTWSASGRFNEEDGRLAWIDRVYADMCATRSYTIELVATPSDVSRRFAYVGNYTGGDANAVTVENFASPAGAVRWWNSGNPNWVSSVKVTQGETAILSIPIRDDLKRIFKSGTLGASTTAGGWVGSDGRATAFGGDNSRDTMAFKGTFQGLRLYSRPLSAEEVAINAAIDRIRYGGETKTLAELMPSGWSFQSNGKLLRAYAGTTTLENGTVVDGDATFADGTVLTCTYPNATYAQLRVTGTLTGSGTVTFKLPDATNTNYKATTYVLLEAASIPDGLTFALDTSTNWNEQFQPEFSIIDGETKDQVVVRLAPIGSTIPAWSLHDTRRLGLTGAYVYWHPADAATGVWTDSANWRSNTYNGVASAWLPGHRTNATYEYIIFPYGGTVRFTSRDTWTHAATYLTMLNGPDNPVVFTADDPAFGLDMRSQKSSAFSITRGGCAQGSLRIESGTYDATYFDLTGQDGSEYAQAKFEQTGGTVNITQDVRSNWHAYDRTTLSLTGGALNVGGTFYLGHSEGGVSTYTQNGADVTVTGNLDIGTGNSSQVNARLESGTLTVGGTLAFTGADTYESVLELAGGRLVLKDITRVSTNQAASVILNGGTLVPTASSDTWLANANFLTVAFGATARVDTDGKDVTWCATLTDTTGGKNFSFMKSGAGTFACRQTPSLTGTFTVAAGTVRLADETACTNTVGTLALAGGTRVVLDVCANGADAFANTALDLSGASSENPVTFEFVYTGLANLAAGETRTLVATGMTEADLSKLRVAGTRDTLAVVDGALMLTGATTAGAARTWSGAAGDGKWSTSGNWTGNTIPTNGDVATFATAGGTTTFDLGDVLFGSIFFGADAGAFTHTGTGALKIQGAITNASASAQTFDVPVRLGQAGMPFAVDNTGDVTLTNVVVASTTLTKSGTGTFAIADDTLAALTDVTVNAGTLKLAARTDSVTQASAGGTVRVASGAAFDLCEARGPKVTFAASEPTHGKTFEIAGAGPDGQGALVNSESPTDWNSALSRIVLTDDATIGGGQIGVRAVAKSAQSEVSVKGGHVLTVKNAGGTLTLCDVDFALQRLNIEGLVQIASAWTGTIDEGIHFKDGSIASLYSANVPSNIAFTVEDNASVTWKRGGGASKLAGAVTIGEGATLSVQDNVELTLTGSVTNNGTLNLAGNSLHFRGTNLVGGVYNVTGRYLWLYDSINSPESAITIHGGSSSGVALGEYVAGAGLPTLGSITCDNLGYLWFITGRNVSITNGVFDSLVNATQAGTLNINTMPGTTTTVERATWNVGNLHVGWQSQREGHLVLGEGANVTVTGEFQTGTVDENPLATSVTLKQGSSLTCTSTYPGITVIGRFLSDAASGGTGLTHRFDVEGGTFSVPNGYVQFGRGSDIVYTTLADGLIDVKGFTVRMLAPYRADLHDERFIQRGGELRVGPLGINSPAVGAYGLMNWMHPNIDFAAGKLTATADFALGKARALAAFGESPIGGGSYTVDLAGYNLTWDSPLMGASDVTISGAGTFTSSADFQGIPLGRWTVTNTTDAIDLSGAAGFAGGLALAPGAQAYVDMGSTGVVEVLFSNTSVGFAKSNDSSKDFTGVCPSVVQSLGFLHEPNATAAVSAYSHLIYRGEFYVPAEKAGTWYFAGNYDAYLNVTIDGTNVIATASNTEVGTAQIALAAGWHSFRITTYDGVAPSGPYVDAWKSAKMALGYSTEAASAGSVAPSAYTRFDSDTLAMRLSTDSKSRTSMRFRALGLQGAKACNASTYTRADQVFRGCDVVTNDFAALREMNAQPLLSQNNARYEGYFYVPATNAGTWTFTGKYDDRIALEIDGAQVFVVTVNTCSSSGSLALTEGWHAFAISTFDNAGGYGPGTLLDDNGVRYAVLAKAANAEKTLAFSGANFRIVANIQDAQKFAQGGLGGVTTLGAGATLANRAEWGACPITGVLEGAGALTGRFAFAGGTWRVAGRNGRLTSCADMTGVTTSDYLAGLARIEADFTAGGATASRYVLGPAGSLTAADAAKIVVEVQDEKGTQTDWQATVINNKLQLVNPHPAGCVIILR